MNRAYDDGPVPECPVCTGNDAVPPCDETCERIVVESARRLRIRGLLEASWGAIGMAARYMRENGGDDFDPRIEDCLFRVESYMSEVRSLRVLREEDAFAALAMALRDEARLVSTIPAPAMEESHD